MTNAFIITKDSETAQILLKLGFIPMQNNYINAYTFLNNPNISFTTNVDLKKISYSNTLCF